MATAIKTVEYVVGPLASLPNNTLTTIGTTTVYLPESGIVFRSVRLLVTMDDIITATGGSITTKLFGVQLGAAAWEDVTNSNTLTHSGENLSLWWEVDFTNYFTTNWSGSSMTVGARAQINQSTGTTLGMVNVCATLQITYEYDDTSPTQVKTAWIPLDAPTGALPTSKPGTPTDTIPALDTYCPEANKVFRQIASCLVFNTHRNGATADLTLSQEVDALGATTTQPHVIALASDRLHRYVTPLSFATNSTHGWYLWGSQAKYHHPQAWLIVTYEFTLAGTTDELITLWVPPDRATQNATWLTSGIGSDMIFRLRVPEATPTLQRAALYLLLSQLVDVDPQARLGTGSFVAYTDSASTICGANALMLRDDAALSLSRGVNTWRASVVRSTSTTQACTVLSSLLLVNYRGTASTPGRAARTVITGIFSPGASQSATRQFLLSGRAYRPAGSFALAEPALLVHTLQSDTAAPTLAAYVALDGGVPLQVIDLDTVADQEVGLRSFLVPLSQLFARWSGDVHPGVAGIGRSDITTARNWVVQLGSSATAFVWCDILDNLSYQAYAFGGEILNGPAGTNTITLHDADGPVAQTTRSGNGPYTFAYPDPATPLWVEVVNSAGAWGRSSTSTAV